MGRANRKSTGGRQVRTESLASYAEDVIPMGQIVQEGRQAEADLATASDPEAVRGIVAPLAARYFRVMSLMGPGGSITYPGRELSLRLLDWLGDHSSAGLRELREEVRHTNNRLELREMLRSDRETIDYLQNFWGPKTREKLSGLTQTRPETVQKWLDGSNPSSSNSTALGFLATIAYQLQEECGQSEGEARDWFEKRHPAMGKLTVEDVLHSANYYWSLPQPIAEALRAEGADL